MAYARILFGFLPALLVLPSCTSGIEDAPRDEACLQARYAVAATQYACGVDPAKANAAYEQFGETYTCVAPSARSADFECAERILETPCAAVVARAADDPSYLNSAAACPRIFRRTDGGPLLLSSVPSKNPVCEQLALRYFAPAAACSFASTGNYSLGEDSAEAASARFRADTFAGRAALDAAFSCVATDPGLDPAACLEAMGCSVQGPPARDVLLAAGSPCAALLGSPTGVGP